MKNINSYLSESIHGNLGLSDSVYIDSIKEQLEKWNFDNGGYGYDIIAPKKSNDPYIIDCHNWQMFLTISDDSSFQIPVMFKGNSNTLTMTFNVQGNYKNFLKNISVKNTSLHINYSNVKNIIIDDDVLKFIVDRTKCIYSSLIIASDVDCNIDLSNLSYQCIEDFGINLKNGGTIKFNPKQKMYHLAISGDADDIHNLPQVNQLRLNLKCEAIDIFDIFYDYKQMNPKLSLQYGTKALLDSPLADRQRLLDFFRTGVKK